MSCLANRRRHLPAPVPNSPSSGNRRQANSSSRHLSGQRFMKPRHRTADLTSMSLGDSPTCRTSSGSYSSTAAGSSSCVASSGSASPICTLRKMPQRTWNLRRSGYERQQAQSCMRSTEMDSRLFYFNCRSESSTADAGHEDDGDYRLACALYTCFGGNGIGA